MIVILLYFKCGNVAYKQLQFSFTILFVFMLALTFIQNFHFASGFKNTFQRSEFCN